MSDIMVFAENRDIEQGERPVFSKSKFEILIFLKIGFLIQNPEPWETTGRSLCSRPRLSLPRAAELIVENWTFESKLWRPNLAKQRSGITFLIGRKIAGAIIGRGGSKIGDTQA